MAHRVNFNVYRYGKTIGWNFNTPGTNLLWAFRANYIMQHWVKRVLKSKNIRVVRVYSNLSGEFPTIKVIGYREVYLRHRLYNKTGHYGYWGVLRSKKTPGAGDLLPIPANRVKTRLTFPIYRRKKWRNTQLRGNWRNRSPAIARTAYFSGLFPILRNPTHPRADSTAQVRQLMYFESLFNPAAGLDIEAARDDQDGAITAESSSEDKMGVVSTFDLFCAEQVSNWNFDLDYILNLVACQKMIWRNNSWKTRNAVRFNRRFAYISSENRRLFEQAAFLGIVKDKILKTQSRGPFNFVASHLWAMKLLKDAQAADSFSGADVVALKTNFDFAFEQLVQLKLGFALMSVFKKYFRLEALVRRGNTLKNLKKTRDGEFNPFWPARLFLVQSAGLLESAKPIPFFKKGMTALAGIGELRLLVYFLSCTRRRLAFLTTRKRRQLKKNFYSTIFKIFHILEIKNALFNPFFYIARRRLEGDVAFFWPALLLNSKDELEVERVSFAKFYARFIAKYGGLNALMLNGYSSAIKTYTGAAFPVPMRPNRHFINVRSFLAETATFVRWSTKREANLFFIHEAHEKSRIFNLQSFRALCADYLENKEELKAVPFLAPDEKDTSLSYWRGAMVSRAYIKPLPFVRDVADTMSLSTPAAPKREAYTGAYDDESRGTSVFFTESEIRLARERWKKIIKSLEINIKAMGLALRAQTPDVLNEAGGEFAVKRNELARSGLIINGYYFSKFTALNLSMALWKAIKGIVLRGGDFDSKGRFTGSYSRGLFSEPRRIIEFNSTITRLWGMVVEKDVKDAVVSKSKSALAFYNNPHLVGKALWISKYPFSVKESIRFDFKTVEGTLMVFGSKHIYDFFTTYSPYNTVLTEFEFFDAYKEMRRGTLSYPELWAEKNNIVMLPTRQLAEFALDGELMGQRKDYAGGAKKTFFSSAALYLFAPKTAKYSLLFQVTNSARLLGNAVAYYYLEAPVERKQFKLFTRHSPEHEGDFEAVRTQVFIMAALSFAETLHYKYLEAKKVIRAKEFYKRIASNAAFLKHLWRASGPMADVQALKFLYGKKNLSVGKNIVLFITSASVGAVEWLEFLDLLHLDPDKRNLAIHLGDYSADSHLSRPDSLQISQKKYVQDKLDDPQLASGYWHDYSTADELVDLSRPHLKDSKGVYTSEFYETRTFLLNLSSGFYNVFGIYYNIFYYPVTKVFESHPRMRELASNSVHFLNHYVTRRPKEFSWLSEFLIIYYICVYLRITEPLVYFMTKVFTWEFRWNGPLNLMWTVMKSVNLREFGISSIRVGFHGKYSGKERAFRLYRILGVNPCLRNAHLTGSYSFRQIKSKYGTSHLHIWMTFV